MHRSFYTVDYTFVATLPNLFEKAYGYNELQVGLAYLPRGGGIIIGSYFTGKLMDRNYRMMARRHSPHSSEADLAVFDSADFPIEQARTRGTYWLILLSTCTTVGYGWATSRAVHPSVPLVLQFIQGFWGTYFYTTYAALMVDLFPEKPSTASAATSVARCAMAAAGVAILEPLMNVMGRAWYFTILGLWSGIFGVAAVYLLRRNGLTWRQARGTSRNRAQTANSH